MLDAVVVCIGQLNEVTDIVIRIGFDLRIGICMAGDFVENVVGVGGYLIVSIPNHDYYWKVAFTETGVGISEGCGEYGVRGCGNGGRQWKDGSVEVVELPRSE